MTIVFSYLVPFVVGLIVAVIVWKLSRQIQRALSRAVVRAGVISVCFSPTIIFIPIDSHTGIPVVYYAWLAIYGGIADGNSTRLLWGIVPMLASVAVLAGIFRLYTRDT